MMAACTTSAAETLSSFILKWPQARLKVEDPQGAGGHEFSFIRSVDLTFGKTSHR